MIRKLTVLPLLLLAAGCASMGKKETPTDRDQWLARTRAHVFLVDEEGRYRDPAKMWNLLSSGEKPTPMRPQIEAISNSLTAFAATNNQPDRRVVVFVHGGMNPYSDGYERLKRLTTNMLGDNCYPIFIVWNSGLPSSYWEHLTLIRQGERRPYFGRITAPFMFVVDLTRGIARLPMILSGRIENDLRTGEFPDSKRTRRWELFEAAIATNRSELVQPPANEHHTRSWSERIRNSTLYTLTLPTKTAILPILDGVGSEAWDLMLRRTKTMFEPPMNYELSHANLDQLVYPTNNAVSNINRWLRHASNGRTNKGAMYIFSRLLTQWTTNQFKELPFEFYGHSMGAIVLNELFRVNPRINTTNIVYLGAACSIREFEQSLFPYLRRRTNTHFYSLSLHRIRERNEVNLWDLPPRGSLLNWIDDIFAKPKTITDRTLGSWDNILRALPDIPDELQTRIHLRAISIEPGFLSTTHARRPQVHGDFDNFPFWRPAYYWREIGEPEPVRLKPSAK